jgi:hypothetical protein
MPDTSQTPDPSWTDEDVEQARRKANRRTAILAVFVFLGTVLLAIADYLGTSQSNLPPAQAHNLIRACHIGAGVVFFLSFFLFFAVMSAWLNLVQRRGRREPDQGDIV